MVPTLSAEEARVIGCLMEKSVTTPNAYPLTLNALTSACNQKSARNPVMSMDKGEVQRTVRLLDGKGLVRIEENFKSGVEKYTQRFCNTRYSDIQFDPAQFSIICLMLLRGPQTPGELRAHSGRLHTFQDKKAVENTLASLIEREGVPLVVELPRTPGRTDPEYTHLFSGPVDAEAYAAKAQSHKKTASTARGGIAELAERVAALEEQVALLLERVKGEQ